MKHFRKTHGLNTSLTFLAIFLAMAGMFFMGQQDSYSAEQGQPINGDCGATVQGQSITGIIDENLFCDAGTLTWTDSGALDGTYNRSCDGIDQGIGATCIAYRALDVGNILQGSGFTTSGNYIMRNNSGTLTISGIDYIGVTGGAWNGMLLPPTRTGQSGSGGIATGTSILLTIQAGATGGVGLTASGGYFTIEFTVPTGHTGQILKIYRSENGNNRIPNIPDDSCTLTPQLRCSFRTDHLSYFTVGSITWNNMNYLNSTFRAENPGDGHIIAALYGTGGSADTAYTQNRSGRDAGDCDLTGMVVQYVGPGTGTIPQQLSGNTIYVLTGGNYITTGTINLSGCGAIIGATGSYLYSSGILYGNGIFTISGENNTIIDNVTINGTGGGPVLPHVGNPYGINLSNMQNSTLNNIQTFNNSLFGIISSPAVGHVMINQTKVYNNMYGILIYGLNNIINNVQTYNNKENGLRVVSDRNVINNTQVYNNSGNGIIILSGNWNIINNTISYNNGTNGLYFSGNSNNNILNNIQAYNNNYGIYLDDSAGNEYYGTEKLFNNASGNTGGNSNLVQGVGGFLISFGRTTGTISTGTILTRSYITNPYNGSGSYLLSVSTGYSYVRGQFASWLGTQPVIYSIGGYIPLQTQPVKRNIGYAGLQYYGLSGTSTSTGDCDRYPSRYIGSDVFALTGNITFASSAGTYSTINGLIYSSTGNITVNVVATGSNYLLLGSNFTLRTGTFTSYTDFQTGMIITGTEGSKGVFLQLQTGGARASHYGFNFIMDTISPTLTGRTLTGSPVLSGGYYTTGVFLTGADTNFSGAILIFNTGAADSIIPSSSTTGLATSNGLYKLTIYDYAGNTTGITFTIDNVAPTFTGASNGGYYNTGITITRSDSIFSGNANRSGFLYSGGSSTGTFMTFTGETTYTVTGYDKAGNFTGVTFTIDKTKPTIGGAISGTHYSGNVTITGYDAVGFSGFKNGTTFYPGTGYTFTGDGSYTITGYDYANNTSTGLTFTIDTLTPVITGMADSIQITGGYSNNTYQVNQITLYWSDANIQTVNLTGTTISAFSSTANTGYKTLTGDGTYVFTVTDKAGHTTGMSFTFFIALSGTASYYSGNAVNMIYKPSDGNRYTNNQGQLLFRSNKTATLTVTGNFDAPNPYTTTLGANAPTILAFTLTHSDGQKFLYTTFQAGTEIVTGRNSFYMDLSGPVAYNIYPAIGAAFSGVDVPLGISGSDVGVGMSGYYYYIWASGSSYIISGFTTSIAPIVPYYKFLTSGTYLRNVVGMDQLGNLGTSGSIRSFNYTATVDAEPAPFSFTAINDAETNKAYISNIITITGLTLNVEVPATIDNGVLYISGIVVGRTGTVRQGSQVKIELISSSDINKTVSSTLTIGSQTAKFKVKTTEAGEGTSVLSTATKLDIVTMFDTIADLYANNISKQGEFMATFKSMLEDLISTMEDDNSLTTAEERKLAILNYMLDLTEEFIDDHNISEEDTHTAPNGRVYVVVYDDAKACYTSPNFLTANKCFPTLAGMKAYINANNVAWTHTVDTTRKAQNYQAPSGKTYAILKTTTGKYFSYRFISPKYFNSLKEAQDYIKKNNPKGKGR